ncbi:MAG: sigma-70 family RNA polymerase sigma factor [Pyrinomonadaceae bacterium]
MERLAQMTQFPTNRHLLAACKNGDREAMHHLYVGNQRRVYSVALNYFGGNRELAEDITQKVFLKLLSKLDFRGDSEFTTWLYRITVNACTDEARKINRFVDLSGIFSFGEPRGGEMQQLMAETAEISGSIQREVAKLRPKLREPIILKYVEGLSYQEIAEVLECSIGTVASRLNRGHKILASRLGHLKSAI